MHVRREWMWVPLCYALAVAGIYVGLWHQHGTATGLGWDTIDTHGPDLDFFASDLRRAAFSLWNPFDKGGYPVFCDPVFDRYYPLNWPFATWGAIAGTSWWLVQLKVMAHHVLAATLMHAFLRSRGLSLRASFVGGLGLVASAPLLVHKASNILWPLVWVPLVWIAIDRALDKPTWRRGAAVGAAMLPVLTAGSPPGVLYATLVIVPYAGLRLIQRLRAHRTREELVALAWTIAPAAVIVALIAAVTILPTSDLVALGSRDRLGTGPGFALAGSMNLPAALRGVLVRGAGPFEIYIGATLTLLAIVGVVVRPRFDRDAPIALVGTALLGVILAAGTTAALLPFLVRHVPLFALLRVPGRYKLLTAWGLAAAAGYGVAALEAAFGDPKLRRRVWITVAVVVAVVVLCVAIAGLPATPKDRPAWWSLVAITVPAVLIAIRKKTALAALALVVVIDAPLFTFVEPGAPPAAEPRQTHDRDAEVVAKLEGVHDRWRIYDEFVLGERAGARLRIRDFRGYPAVDPISLHRYVDVLEYAKQDPRILTDYNVRYLLIHPHWRYGFATSFPHAPFSGFTPHDGIYEAQHPAPLISWYGEVDIAGDHVLDAVRKVEEPGGQRRRAIVEPHDALALPLLERLSGEPGFVEGALEWYSPDSIGFSIDAPRAGLVVLDEIMFPGWEVYVDGQRATPIRANYLLRGVWVSAGRHEVNWQFSPAHWRVLVAGYALTLLFIGFAAMYRRRS